jgi:hypothetical protein
LGSIGIVCRLRRIQSSRYEIGLQMQKASAVELSYVSLVSVGSFTVDNVWFTVTR